MHCVSSSRMIGFKSKLLAALAGCAMMAASPAFAQQSECEELGKVLNNYGSLMQRAQSFQKKKPTPDEACSVFTGLQNAGVNAVKALEKDGAWCHAPEQALVNIKSQQDQISKVKANACQVAAQMKKQMQQQQQQGPGLLGGGEVLGGPMRVPQGAL